MKRSLRAILLLAGLLTTFAYGAVPKTTTHGGPMPLCDPNRPKCDAVVGQ